MEVLILGAGAWGTALAIHIARKIAPKPVGLWTRDPAHAQQIKAQGCNHRYLPATPLPANVDTFAGDPGAAIAASQLLVLASPVAGLRVLLQKLHNHSGAVVWVCKGFEADTGLLPHEMQAAVAPTLHGGSLSGPSFAQEVADGLPCALTMASVHPHVCKAVTHYLHNARMRIYERAPL